MSIKASPVGIDLGGTYSCVQIFQQHGNVEFIQSIEGERKLPTYKAFPDSEHLITFFKSIEDMGIHPGISVKDVVVSVPACFNELQRHAIKDAGNMAGLNVLHIINEQIAAAIGYCFKKKLKIQGKRKFLIFDGDVSIFVIEDGKIVMQSTSAGGCHLGREDFDNLMFKAINSCPSIKRDDFEELAHLIRDLVEKGLQDAKMKKTDIVVLLGSWTRIPKVQKRLKDLSKGKTLDFVEFDIVASGAAIICAILKGNLDIGIHFHDATFLGNQTCADAENLEVTYPSDSGNNFTGKIPSNNQETQTIKKLKKLKAIRAQSTDVPSAQGLLPNYIRNLVLTDQAPTRTNQELRGQPADRIPFFHGQPADVSPTWPEFIDLGLFPDQPSNVFDAESVLACANEEKSLD